jgi:hypothetical protein
MLGIDFLLVHASVAGFKTYTAFSTSDGAGAVGFCPPIKTSLELSYAHAKAV